MKRAADWELRFEPAETEDIRMIFSLSKALIDQYEDVDSIDYEKVIGWVKRKLEKNIASYTRVMAGGKLAGWYCLDREPGELDDLYILPEHREMGLGTAVIKKCIAECEKPLWLYVFKKNVRAISLYRRMGFVIREEVGKTRYIMGR